MLVPAADGRYHLIGLRRALAPLFGEIPWGTSEVLARTVSIAQEIGISVARLDPLKDVDRPEDLKGWNALLHDSQLQHLLHRPEDPQSTSDASAE